MLRRMVPLAAVVAMTLTAACAQLPTDPEERAEAEAVNDPLEPTNRVLYDVNMFLDDNVAAPVAEAYRDNFPEWFRTGVHNVLTNLEEPYVAGNDLLQGNVHAAADALGRFMINSTFGALGTRDAAVESGGPKGHKTDIGITLAVWGVEEGPYLMLPFFGPSNLRDGSGRVADYWADPAGVAFAAKGLGVLSSVQMGFDTLDNRTTYLDPLKEIRRTSIDEYAAIRSLYRQNRDATIAAARNGQSQARERPPEIAVPAAAKSATGQAGAAGAAAPPPGVQPDAVEFIDPKN